jgi:hypothetical protein
MTVHEASCRCGRVRARCTGEPVRVSVCHCVDCQKRSGSAFAVQARWPDERVELTGEAREWSIVGDSGRWFRSRFCPECGATIAYTIEAMPGVTAIPVGAFADPGFPPPEYSVYEDRKHAWVSITGAGTEHFD